MDTNPYGPPKAAVADISPRGLKRRSVVLMIVLFIVTFGLYYPYLVPASSRRIESTRFSEEASTLALPGLFRVVCGRVCCGALHAGFAPNEQIIGAGGSALLDFSQIAVGILMAVQCFIIEGHPGRPSDRAGRPRLRLTLRGTRKAIRSQDIFPSNLLPAVGNQPRHRRFTAQGYLTGL